MTAIIFSVGHRFRQKYDFGLATLDILYAYPEDSGMYECRATNSRGSDVTRTQLRCSGRCVWGCIRICVDVGLVCVLVCWVCGGVYRCVSEYEYGYVGV